MVPGVKRRTNNTATAKTQCYCSASIIQGEKSGVQVPFLSLSSSSILTLSCQWSSSMWSRYSYKSTHCLNSFPFLNPDNSQRTQCINIHSSAPQISKCSKTPAVSAVEISVKGALFVLI